MEQPTIKILSGDLEGTYRLRWPMTQGDWEVVWDIANVGMLEFSSEIGRGNPKLLRALMTLAMTQSGRVIEPRMLDYIDPLSGLEMEWPDEEAETNRDGSPLATTSDGDGELDENGSSGGSSETSGKSLAVSLASAPDRSSGNPGSDESSMSDHQTSAA